MKFLLQVLMTIVIGFLLQLFLPWWTISLSAFASACFFSKKSYVAFIAGFAGAGLLWLGMALYTESATNGIISQKVNQLLPLSSLLMTTVVGGLVGGFAALTGALLKGLK